MFRFLSICISYPSTFISSPISDSTWLCSVHELGSLLTWTSKLQCKFESYQVNSPHSNWLRGKKKKTTQYHCYPIESSSLNKQYLGGADFCSFALLSLLSRHPSLPPQLNTNHSVILWSQSWLSACFQNTLSGACIVCGNISMLKGHLDSSFWSQPSPSSCTWDESRAGGVGSSSCLWSWSNSCSMLSPSVHKPIYWLLAYFFEMKII